MGTRLSTKILVFANHRCRSSTVSAMSHTRLWPGNAGMGQGKKRLENTILLQKDWQQGADIK
jgi:hypothetical protein